LLQQTPSLYPLDFLRRLEDVVKIGSRENAICAKLLPDLALIFRTDPLDCTPSMSSDIHALCKALLKDKERDETGRILAAVSETVRKLILEEAILTDDHLLISILSRMMD